MITTSHKDKEPQSADTIFYSLDIFLLVFFFFFFQIRTYFLFHYFFLLLLSYILCYFPESIILHKTMCSTHTHSPMPMYREYIVWRWMHRHQPTSFCRIWLFSSIGRSFSVLGRYTNKYISKHIWRRRRQQDQDGYRKNELLSFFLSFLLSRY